MKNALILHGAGNNSQGNWFPSLKKQLEKVGYLVWAPDLPNSDVPIQKDWLKVIFSNKSWHFDDESVIVGHSAGATLILRILEKLPKALKINKAILVAGPVKLGTKPEYFPYKRDVVKNPFDWNKIQESIKDIYFFYSDNDKYECGIENWELIKNHLQGHLLLRPGQGHFNLEVGPQYKDFPELLEIINSE